jgi:predicted dienelactone hydrolase
MSVRLVIALALVAGALGAVSAAAAPGPDPSVVLPEPSGPFGTGTTLLHLRDAGRPDPLDPAHAPRELMAQLWYPTSRLLPGRVAPYVPPGEATALEATWPVPPGAFSGPTHSRLDVPALPLPHPMVFFYHGICADRTDTTAVNEELASRGFVVVALASTHESNQVEFPDGRVVSTSDRAFCAAGADPFSEANQAVLNRMQQVRVADVRYTMDTLAAANRGGFRDGDGKALPPGLAGTLRTTGVGIFGHSFGGSTAAEVLHEDARFTAGVNLDGLVAGPVRTAGLRKPFLVLGSDYHELAVDPSWMDFLPRLDGWHRWYRVRQAGHYRFMDLGGSTHRWAWDTTLRESDPETWRTIFGDIGDRESQRLVVSLTTAFFQRFLQGVPSPVLTDPTRYFPRIDDRTSTIPHT